MMEKMEKPSPKSRKSATAPRQKVKGSAVLPEAGTGPFLSQPHTRLDNGLGLRVDDEPALSDGAIDRVINRAADVIGDRQEAMRWLGTPIRGLDFATPISLLATEDGRMRVTDILGQMEHGIW